MWQDRQVAVKRLRQSLMQADESLAEEFQAEVRFMRLVRVSRKILTTASQNSPSSQHCVLL